MSIFIKNDGNGNEYVFNPMCNIVYPHVQNEQLCNADVPEAGDGMHATQAIYGQDGIITGHRSNARTGSSPSCTGESLPLVYF